MIGSDAQLGNWKDFVAHMKWTDDHVWVLENVHISFPKTQHLLYKYVVLNDGKPGRWEEGPNRILDLTYFDINTSQINMKDKWNQCKVVSNPKALDQSKVVIIRHANSTFNLAQKDQNYKGNPNHDYSLIDAPLSHIGLQ